MIVRKFSPFNLGRSIICLGKQGEVNALRVEFDVSAWMAMYPDATVKLMHFAPDRPQDNPVIPTLGVEGTLRVWIVGEEDTAGAGNGVIELLLIDERTGSTIKSATGYTTVLRSPSAGIEAQEPEPGYVRYDVDQSALLTDTQKAFARTNIDAIKDEKDPTVPDWAKQPRKPTYTASEVGALPSSYTPPVTSVNGMTGAVALSAQDVGARPDTWTPSASEVGADAAGTASGAVAAHNTSGAAHADLRALIEGLNSRLNTLADSDDTTLDQLSEIVAYIKSNKTLIDAVTTGKVSTSDIVDNLTTNASGKVLSAAQGVALKAMIDGIVIPSALPNPQPITINGQRYDGSEAVTVTTVEIDDTLTQIGKASDAKAVGDRLNELNEDITEITPDDTAVDGKPWTSKKIVDSICQPFEESGNPVQCYPVENYPLGVKVSWEPTQEGEGDPSPDNIRPITGRDAVSVTRCGKNLIDTSSLKQDTVYGVTITPNNDGSLTVNGTATQTHVYMISEYKQNLLINGITYTLSGTPSGADGLTIQIWNKEWLGDHVEDRGNGGTFTPSKQDIVPHGIAIRFQGGKSYDNVVVKPQLEIGSSRTDFEPYAGDTYDIALPDTVYGGTIDVVTGVVTMEYGHIESYAGESLPGDWISDRDVYAPDATPTTGAQVAYKIETPYTIQLSPQQIAALSGVNTIYTDADGVIVTGAEDPKHTITELKNAIISLGGNI